MPDFGTGHKAPLEGAVLCFCLHAHEGPQGDYFFSPMALRMRRMFSQYLSGMCMAMAM